MSEVVQTRAQRVLIVVGIIVLGFNLRPAAVSVGPVLSELSAGLDIGPATAGVLTSLPVLAFAVFGGLAPAMARAVGVHRLTFLSLVGVVVGLGLRAVVSNVPLFFALSLLSLVGMATANVLLPSLIKLHFPNRVGLMTALYTTAMSTGLTLTSALTFPISEALGSWRWGLGVWAGMAVVAAIPWLALVRHDVNQVGAKAGIGLARVAKTRLGWAMALVFALQSMQAYTVFGWFAQLFRDEGYSAHDAGLLLGLTTGVTVPLSFVIAFVGGRMRNPAALILVLIGCYAVGYGGLLFAPAAAGWLWAILVGTGSTLFPLVLLLIGLRARTPEGTAALSGFTQSVGYLIAAPGPFLIGVLYDRTGSWDVPLIVMLAGIAALALAALSVARERYIEDELTPV